MPPSRTSTFRTGPSEISAPSSWYRSYSFSSDTGRLEPSGHITPRGTDGCDFPSIDSIPPSITSFYDGLSESLASADIVRGAHEVRDIRKVAGRARKSGHRQVKVQRITPGMTSIDSEGGSRVEAYDVLVGMI